MIEKTRDYDRFIFRKDNREKIDESHVKRLTESIRQRNLLELRPILVNSRMEVIDGQHRVLAAKNLGVEVYYQVEASMTPDDIIRMNVSKQWSTGDFLNFYCEHGYEDYIKLRSFIKDNNITIKIASGLALGQEHQGRYDFREGKFKFTEDVCKEQVDLCWNTIHIIKKHNGFSGYTNSSKFWKSLIKLFRHPNFEKEKWIFNSERMVDSFCAKPSEKLYEKVVEKVYNWRNTLPISISGDE